MYVLKKPKKQDFNFIFLNWKVLFTFFFLQRIRFNDHVRYILSNRSVLSLKCQDDLRSMLNSTQLTRDTQCHFLIQHVPLILWV